MLLFVNLILRLGYSVKSAHTLVEPRHELRLDKRLAPCHGVHSLPALVDERRQVAQRAVDTLVGLNKYSGVRWRTTVLLVDMALYGSIADTALAVRCMKIRRFPIMESLVVEFV